MGQRVDVMQLAILDTEEVGVGCSTAAWGRAGAESTVGHYGSHGLVDHEVAVHNVHAARYANVAGILRSSLAGAHAALGAIEGETPRHQVLFALEKRIQVRVRPGVQRVARVALGRRNDAPILGGRVLEVVI